MFILLFASICQAGTVDQPNGAAGIPKRVPWTGSRIIGSPEPPPPYRTERMFPKLTFLKPLDIAFAPRLNRVFVAEQGGRIYSFPNDEGCEKADLFADLPKAAQGISKVPFAKGVSNLYGFAFHPRFQQNRYVYVCYTLDIAPPGGHAPMTPRDQEGTRVSRFEVTRDDPPRIVPASETVLLTWFAGGHNGGCVKFGPEGDLYVSSGDGGDPDPPDPFNTGQDISDLLCSILRIDVDHAAGGKPYSIPADNPFIHTPGARPEVYALGLRNPWRFSFDRATGQLWCGDVGWELWESVDCVKPGGNYGWSIMEGPNPVHPDGPRGPTPITPPALALDHTEAASLTGGVVYRGKKLPELVGHYLFGDWQTARLWDAKVNGDGLEPHRTIAQTDQRIVAFGEDADGEPIIVDHQGGGLWRIVRNQSTYDPAKFPRKLSETGLFADVKAQAPAPGVIPFAINAPQWVDGATAKRWIAIPGAATMTWGKGVWGDDKPAWPANSVLVRTLSMEGLAGKSASAQPIETQVLHFDGRQWQAYTYAWNAGHTDADLVGAEGDDRTLTVPAAQDVARNPLTHNGVEQRTWHFASRVQCLTCHNVWDDYALAFTVPQLDRIAEVGGTKDNQVRAFRRLGFLLQPKGMPDDSDNEKAALTDPYDTSADLRERARSYLAVNCSVCHRFGGGGAALFDVRKELAPAKMNLVDARPNLGSFGLDEARIVCPGDPTRSVLLYRIAKLGRGRMPRIGSDVVDQRGIQLMIEWIRSLAPDKRPDASADAKRFQDSGTLDRLLGSPTGALAIICALHAPGLDGNAFHLMTSKGLSAKDEAVHDLFRPFDPNEQAHPKIGSNVNAARLLALRGDAARGRPVFFGTGATSTGLCARCHKVNGEGTDFGPDLSHIASKYNRTDLLDNILNPSKTIAPGYATTVIRTKSGDTFSGILVTKSDQGIVLKTPDLKQTRIAAADADRVVTQSISAMPEGLLSDLEPQQAADLLAFVASLK
ncbi:MAG TPA: PQQ-dependent sugar dehydrogenase [Tepidisphaeraceae bacterium]|jgi:putative heme-binding domain-containing protein